MNLKEQIIQSKKEHNILRDIISGVIIALVSIPISMGYAQIAGLPAVYGLYGSLLPILVFAFFTTSPMFVVGVDAMPAAMTGSLLMVLGIKSKGLETVPVLTLLVAMWFFIFYLLKAGRMVKYISTPVMGGFITGVALSIILMQVPKLWGGNAGTGEIIDLFIHMYKESSKFHSLSLVLSLLTITIILVGKKLFPKIPWLVIMMIVGMLSEICFDVSSYGIKLLPNVTKGLPKIIIPNMDLLLKHPQELLFSSLSIAAVIMAQTLLASGGYAAKNNYKLNNNQEILAYGLMNVAGALVGSAPINGSVSRSGISDSNKTKSQLMSISASITMGLILMFGTPYLKYLPIPILTSIVICALIGILEFPLAKRLRNSCMDEWLIFIISMISVLLFGTVYGVMIGCILSFAAVAIEGTTPRASFLGRIPGQGNFHPLDRTSTALPIKNTILYRFYGDLFFANIDKFQNDIEKSIKEDTKRIVVDSRSVTRIDITAIDRLIVIHKSLKSRNINFYMAEHSGHLNDEIRQLGGDYLLTHNVMHRTITTALKHDGINKPYELEGDFLNITNDKSERNEVLENLTDYEWLHGTQKE